MYIYNGVSTARLETRTKESFDAAIVKLRKQFIVIAYLNGPERW